MCRSICTRDPRREPCPECEEFIREDDGERNAFEEVCANDPELDPAHKHATDAEWWAFTAGVDEKPVRKAG